MFILTFIMLHSIRSNLPARCGLQVAAQRLHVRTLVATNSSKTAGVGESIVQVQLNEDYMCGRCVCVVVVVGAPHEPAAPNFNL